MAEPVAPGRVLRLDMHSHSWASYDCVCPPERILAAARARGVDRLVVTDHNEIRGALEMQRMDPERILVGEEVKTAEGADIIGILLRERIPKGTPARETCERILEQGGVVYAPHPFDTRRQGAGALLDRIADLVDVVEAHNARTYRPELNRLGEEWALSRGKLLGAGSDAHSAGEIGRGFVEVPPFEPTREGLLGALREGRVAGRVRSSPFVSVFSTWAKVRKLFPMGVR